MAVITEGKKAPAFRLADQHGKTHTLADYAGRLVVLYFYPKDDTPGCTKEACAFQAALPDFGKGKAAVLGVSVLDTASKARFAQKVLAGVPAPRRCRSCRGRQVPGVAGKEHVRQEVHGRRAHHVSD